MSDVMEFVNCAKMESDNKSTALRISKHHKTSLLHEYQMEVSFELFCALTLAKVLIQFLSEPIPAVTGLTERVRSWRG